ncbi:MAG: hypothetical protein J0L84_06855, partial [Verrucomicrobia bacterium]|nr:hypothetical protein [Verrucomicrobiota bacterium]
PWPCARGNARGTSEVRLESPAALTLGIRIEGDQVILIVHGPPSRVALLVATELGSWEPETELTLTGVPVEWVVPPGLPPPAYFQARIVEP